LPRVGEVAPSIVLRHEASAVDLALPRAGDATA